MSEAMNHNDQVIALLDEFSKKGGDFLKDHVAKARGVDLPPRHFTAPEVAQMLTENLNERIAMDRKLGIERDYPTRNISENGAEITQAQVRHWTNRGIFAQPHRDGDKTLGWSLDQIQALRIRLGIAPYTNNCATIAIQNQKGGCWKTASTINLGDDLGTRGRRVLVIDVDPQSSYTLHKGVIPDHDLDPYETIYPFLVKDRPLEEIVQVVRPTRNPNVHFIPGALDVAASAESFAITYASILNSPRFLEQTPEGPRLNQLGLDSLVNVYTTLDQALDHLRPYYDVILLDGTPFLGILALNILSAADFCMIPCPTELPDFASTVRFVQMMADYYKDASSLAPDSVNFPYVMVLPTRMSSNQTHLHKEMLKQIEDTFTSIRVESRFYFKEPVRRHDGIIGRVLEQYASVFDFPLRNNKELGIDRRALERAVKNFQDVTNDVLDSLLRPHWENCAFVDLQHGVVDTPFSIGGADDWGYDLEEDLVTEASA